MSESNTTSGGVSTAGLLGIVFVALKLTGVIDWSWLWVTAPFWIPLAIVVVVFMAMFLGLGVAAILDVVRGKK